MLGRGVISLLLVLPLLQLAAAGKTQPPASKAVTITLKAKWDSTPALLEAAEFLAEEDPALLWKFVDAWHSKASAAEAAGCWDQISKTAGSLLSPAMVKIMQMAMGTRRSSARLELLRTEAEAAGTPQASCAFVDFGGRQAGTPAELRKLLSDLQQLPVDALQIFDFDHVFPSSGVPSEGPSVTAVLYGAIGTEAFWEMHRALSEATEKLRGGGRLLRYVYRPVLLPGCAASDRQRCFALGSGEKLQLPGFGVEMAIKNMEYSALDEKQAQAEESQAETEELSESLLDGEDEATSVPKSADGQDFLQASADDVSKVRSVKKLGVQAVQRIVRSPDPFQTLAGISQNFPNIAGTLSRTKVEKRIKAELKRNEDVLPGGNTFLLLNGAFVDPEVDLFELYTRIHKEVRLAEQLHESGLLPSTLSALLGLRGKAEAPARSSARIDLLSAGHVVFANDLERDLQYRSWSPSLISLLQPMFPGSLPRVARNIFTLVVVIDPGTAEGLRLAAYAYGVASGGQWAVRVGVLLTPRQMLDRVARDGEAAVGAAPWEDLSTGERVAGLFEALRGEEGPLDALAFLAYISPPEGSGAAVSWQDVAAGFGKLKAEIGLSSSIDELAAQVSVASLAKQAASALDVGLAQKLDSMWLNGVPLPAQAPTPQAKLSFGIQSEMQKIQELIYFGILGEQESDIPAFLLQHFQAVPRYNPFVTEATGEQLPLVGELAATAEPFRSLGYLHHAGSEDYIKGTTHWVAVDIETQHGRELLREALLHLRNPASIAVRLGIVQHAALQTAPSLLSRAVTAATLLPARRAKIPDFLIALISSPEEGLTEPGVLDLAERAGLNRAAVQKLLTSDDSLVAKLAQQAKVSRRKLGLVAGDAAVITNGRLLWTHSAAHNVSESLVAADFLLLDHYAGSTQLATRVVDTIDAALSAGVAVLRQPADGSVAEDEAEGVTAEQLSDAALVASSVLAAYLAKDPNQVQGQVEQVIEAIQVLGKEDAGFSSPSNPDSLLEITAVLDPLTKIAQHFSAMLLFLRKTLQPNIKVYLNPQRELSKLPLTSFYRMVLPEFSESEDGSLGLPPPPAAIFQSLPPSKVLTLHMDVPEAWLVEPVRAAHDLDNLRLSDLGKESTLQAEFELEALLLTGACTDSAARKREQVTPRGVQLHLGTAKAPHLVDTLVMSNLGYFQLKAAPGAYNLQLAPGRSRELYKILHAESEASEQAEYSLAVVMDSLQGNHQRLKLKKRPGYEAVDVLEEPEQGGLLSGVSSWFGGSQKGPEGAAAKSGRKLSPEDDPDTIHIFTIASGHMYERLQKIMILSLIGNTKNRVKVWFIKNYMSPQMKRFLPHMARHYGFDYEFVTYKWPAWLHKQTEKQRIIWAYKILFLDVLFPLNLRKVIFVDSDQIMRADFKELWNMDLKGAPLAYTPFCDNNKDMDGFRFWKQGFWKDHLRGRPYHISALYVVDLAKFRQTAAGDQLRIVYEQLSKDPNSLANLDQDLPNFAQNMVPIHSLPQEWLWCETWCGNETKPSAKTIDLCNNPLTKEPKLKGARRIVAEWAALDAEAQAFTAKIEEELSREAQASGTVFDAGEVSLSSKTQEEALAAANGDAATEQPASSPQTEDIHEGTQPGRDVTEL